MYFVVNLQNELQTNFSLASKIDTEKVHAPSFMMLLTGTGHYAHQRKDGMVVVPIGCLMM